MPKPCAQPEKVFVAGNGDHLVIGTVDGTPALFYRDNAQTSPQAVQVFVENRIAPKVGTNLTVRVPQDNRWDQYSLDWDGDNAVLGRLTFVPSDDIVSLDDYQPLPAFICTNAVLAETNNTLFMGVYSLRADEWFALCGPAGAFGIHPVRLPRVPATQRGGAGARMGNVRLRDGNDLIFDDSSMLSDSPARAMINGNPMTVHPLTDYTVDYELGDDGLPTAATITPPGYCA